MEWILNSSMWFLVYVAFRSSLFWLYIPFPSILEAYGAGNQVYFLWFELIFMIFLFSLTLSWIGIHVCGFDHSFILFLILVQIVPINHLPGLYSPYTSVVTTLNWSCKYKIGRRFLRNWRSWLFFARVKPLILSTAPWAHKFADSDWRKLD